MLHRLGTLQINSPRQSGVTAAIQQASAKTGVDFGYLVRQADIESSLNPNAKAKTSSATGLYQFIEQTWLRMMKNHGAEHGFDRFANAIEQKGDGTYTVANRGLKNQILNMRRDPKAASLMAAELASDNHSYLKQTVGGDVTGTDLYLAHFLGADGASNFLNAMKKNPWAPAASLFPEAARANRGVFYQNGAPLSLQAVYNRFDAKFDSNEEPVTQTASAVQSSSGDTEVVLPRALDWSRPSFNSRRTGLEAFAAPIVEGSSATQARVGGFLSSPVDVMMIAQKADFLRYAHDDNDRYNA
ncbi:MAG: transglycosylase SLT domain-containing protein [Alphaproteobacteria bacterium]|nr:transglycosylase SLT domain-containing protein [Alphaproteobacteria bacterium]